MAKNAPGKHYRKGITFREMGRLADDETLAEEFIILARWGDDVQCPRCSTDNVRRNDKAKAYSRFFCRKCRRYFSAKTGTSMQSSNISLGDWLIGIYQFVTNLPGESSMKLHRDIGVTQTSAWHMGHRIRAGLKGDVPERFSGPVQVDESHIGGRSKTMSYSRRAKLRSMNLLGGGPRHMTHVAGMRDEQTGMVRAEVVTDTTAATLQKFVTEHTEDDAVVFTDESTSYNGLPRKHGKVNHSIGEYVGKDDPERTTNVIESLWSNMKGGIRGTYRNISPKHAPRYVDEYVGKHNIRPLDTLDQMAEVIRGMEGKSVKFDDLTAWTGENRYTVLVED